MRYFRTTVWTDEDDQIVQVAVAVLADDWEDLAEATEDPRCYPTAADAILLAREVATSLADRQLAGQQSLL